MQLELSNAPQQPQSRSVSRSPNHSDQDGFQRYHASGPGSASGHPQQRVGSMSPHSDGETLESLEAYTLSSLGSGVHPDSLEEAQLRRLSAGSHLPPERSTLAGHRIAAYENALTPSVPRQVLGFTVIKRGDNEISRVNIDDFPNEILTHILSHLHPDSHASVALVSKRFYSLINSPHAWRMAFQRFFPAQDVLRNAGKSQGITWEEEDGDAVRSEVRVFTRLASQASWRSEYLMRTRLLRSLSRGKPRANSGGVGAPSRTIQAGKKATAVLTYNTKLPSVVTHVHATFKPNGKKPPRVIHGASDFGVGSASDPTIGKVEKWGLDDPFAFAQLDEVMPMLIPYGMGDGPAAMPNVMDLSQPYGLVGGEGFPGGRVFFRPTGEYRGKYLGQETGLVEAYPDIPKIPELAEGICSVWIAKSPSVPTATHSMVGIMTGSSLGVVTTYALGYDPSGPRYIPGEISARWVLSPGVPIIALKVDDNYSQKRRTLNRILAVALNALGEVYYLTQPPRPPASKTRTDDSIKLAWHTGRSTYWHLVEATRRQARPDDSGKNAVRGSYSPRSPSDAMSLKRDQMIAEAREIERFLRFKPAHFRKVCYGWDMRRKLEADFANDRESGAGESFFIIDCGLDDDKTWALRRFVRTVTDQLRPSAPALRTSEPPSEPTPHQSIFGHENVEFTAPSTCGSPPAHDVSLPSNSGTTPSTTSISEAVDDWVETMFHSKETNGVITANAIDMSLMAVVTSFEDPLKDRSSPSTNRSATLSGQASSDIPGRRGRLLGLGTNTGKIVLWNTRAGHTGDGIFPVRIIQTESPEISCLAISALYLVHGGNDGLVQAWDPLASTLDPIRTLISRSPARMPRHTPSLNQALGDTHFSAVGAIYLDPDPTALHGIVAFGTFVRYWAYSSSNRATGRRRRLRHSDVHGRPTGRRHGGGVEGYIAAETEELHEEQQNNAREQARLRARFGVGINNLSEEEALQYAEMMSQESFLLDEQRRISASDTGSAAGFDTASTIESMDTITPDPSVAETTPPTGNTSSAVETMSESEYELQIQTAIRLSLLEGVDDIGCSPKGNSSGEFDGPVIARAINVEQSSFNSPSSSRTPMIGPAGPSSSAAATSSALADDDLELALRLSLEDEENRKAMFELQVSEDEFPPLGGGKRDKGKGRAV